MSKYNPFRYFETSPEIIRLTVMLYVRSPLSLRNVEDLLHERGIEISQKTVRLWWNCYGPMLQLRSAANGLILKPYSLRQRHFDKGVREDQQAAAIPLARS